MKIYSPSIVLAIAAVVPAVQAVTFTSHVPTTISSGDGNCPPPNFNSMVGLNLTSYISAPWYAQMSQVVSYLPRDHLFCLRAEYKLKSENDKAAKSTDSEPSKLTLSVFNSARVGSVTGKPTGGHICAHANPGKFSSKLSVGPCFLPSFLYGPYWVITAGSWTNASSPEPIVSITNGSNSNQGFDSDGGVGYDSYEWAVISGGPPDHAGTHGCRTGTGVNHSGLWLFTRQPVVSDEMVARLMEIAEKEGFDTSVLVRVQQQNCTYPDAL